MKFSRPARFPALPSVLAPALAALTLLACGDSFPIPDEFDAGFTVGRICAPESIATGGANTRYPLRLELCLYRCVSIDRSSLSIRTVYQCAGGQCQMTMLASAHARKVVGEEGCDARELVDPPAGECTNEIIDFDASVPTINGEPQEGTFQVTIPYLELEQGQKLLDRIKKGDDVRTVIQEDVGEQNYPSRQFALEFSASAAPVTSHEGLSCHDVGAP
ncbi:MAG TPA: hypothetical protein VLC09_01635 [Polyangiaceae bacterium]|nr:hypothetical protein [Polyangiaceae bacterium]